mmetsp:Transcript_57036/g.180548  ORF Transcript_57036/g.180548 Transcript_57036/m.180548 type:complete len:233 (+) Transcript_57036:83-781(+)
MQAAQAPRAAPGSCRSRHRRGRQGTGLAVRVSTGGGQCIAAMGLSPLACPLPQQAAPTWALRRAPLCPKAQASSQPPAAPERQQHPVEIRVFNIDKGGYAKYLTSLLDKPVDGIWHIAVVVYGREYWFGHHVADQDLSGVDYADGQGPSYVYPAAPTTRTREEFEEYVFGQLNDKFTTSTYDVFDNNCHHFVNECLIYLCGETIPQWCLDHGEKALECCPRRARSPQNSYAL